MMQKCPVALALIAASGLAVTVRAQVANPETEANETKAQATPAASGGAGMAPTDYITGNSTGTSTTVAGAASADTFLVKTAAASLGIYRHRLTLGATGHAASIRGLNQVAAAAGTWPGPVGTPGTTDAIAQTATGGMVQWYGFGKQEQLYYRVTGTASSTSDYTATLDRLAITPTSIGNFVSGTISFDFAGQGHTNDTDCWIYDSNLSPIPGWGDDDRSLNSGSPYTATALQGYLKRTFAAGTYYIGVSNFQTHNNLPSPCDDNFRTGTLMDFANCVANSSTTTALNVSFAVTDSGGAHPVSTTKAAAFDVNWFVFTVSDPTALGACCLPNGSCTDTGTVLDCNTAGGVWQGDLSVCGSCPQPGACCTEFGCTFILPAACTSSGGVFHAGQTCVEAACVFTGWDETGDAGDLPGTAQTATGSGSLTKIRGNITPGGEGDMFLIQVCDAANFSATTAGGTPNDTILSIYKADGTGVAFNDDDTTSTTALQSRISNTFVGPAGNGQYYLAVTGWNKIPTGASGGIWINDGVAFPYRSERAPDGPGAPGPITSWGTSTSTWTGTYTITLTGACFVGESCYANCDNSSVAPILNANDFQCFLNEYAAGTSYANCDGSSVAPILNANDFQCFLNEYAAGCT